MKHINPLLLIISILFSVSNISSFASDTDMNNITNNIVILERQGDKSTGKRKKMPDKQIISCCYDGESLVVDFSMPDGLCTVTIFDPETNASKSYLIDSSLLTVNLDVSQSQSLYIEIMTGRGVIYEGYIY